MPSTAGIVASGSAQLDQWLRANLIAFDERRSSPLANLGTLGAAGDATATGTRRLVNTGTGAYVWLPGVSGNYLSVPDEAALDITNNLEIVVRVAADDWTPSAIRSIGGKFSAVGQESWMLWINTNGTLRLNVSANGSTDGNAVSSVATGFTDGVAYWLKVRFASGSVTFFKADDAATEPAHGSFAQIGSAVTMSGSITSIFAGTSSVHWGQDLVASGRAFAGTVYRAILRNGIGGTTVLDIDTSVLTDEGATSFTATTGQTVTINRSTGATYKTAIVTPGDAVRLFNGTSSDFLAVADLAGLDVGTGTSFSAWALVRQWATPISNGCYWSKWDGTTGAGWTMSSNGTALTVTAYVDDGPDSATATSPAMTAGGLSLIGFTLDRGANTITGYLNGTAGTPVSASAIGDLSNADILYYGRNLSNNANQAHESYMRGVYPGALTAAQWAALRDALLVPERAAA